MNTNTITVFAAVLVGLINAREAYSQGSFVNLNFENATVTFAYPPSTGEIYANNAIPGWSAYYSVFGTNPQPIIGYDTVSLGGAAVFLEDGTNSFGGGPAPLQGKYSVLLEGSYAGTPNSASIGQTAQIPLNALSLTFYLSLNSSLQVSFNGQLIPLVQTGSTANYDIMGGNISAFAEQTGQLLFTAPPGPEDDIGYGLIDNIQFSNLGIPEPGVFGLWTLGALLVGWRVRGRRR